MLNGCQRVLLIPALGVGTGAESLLLLLLSVLAVV